MILTISKTIIKNQKPFGGIQIIGIPGIILGPLALSIILAVYRLYEEEYASKN